MLLLSRFSRVQLCATPYTAAHQAPPSLGFSRTLEWVAISFSNACKWKVKVKSLSNPMDCSPPASSVHGIFQARVLEWGAIALSTMNCSALIKRENGEMIFCYMWGCSKKATICKPGGEPSLDIESVSTLILDFPVSGTIKNNVCCLSHLALLPGKSHGWRSLVGCSPWGR